MDRCSMSGLVKRMSGGLSRSLRRKWGEVSPSQIAPRGPELGRQMRGQILHGSQLVLGQGLQGKEVERLGPVALA